MTGCPLEEESGPFLSRRFHPSPSAWRAGALLFQSECLVWGPLGLGWVQEGGPPPGGQRGRDGGASPGRQDLAPPSPPPGGGLEVIEEEAGSRSPVGKDLLSVVEN